MKQPRFAIILGHTDPLTDPRVKKSSEALRAAGFRSFYMKLSKGVTSFAGTAWIRKRLRNMLRLTSQADRRRYAFSRLVFRVVVISLPAAVGYLTQELGGNFLIGLAMSAWVLLAFLTVSPPESTIVGFRKALFAMDARIRAKAMNSTVKKLKRLRPSLVYGHEYLAIEVFDEYTRRFGADITFIWDAHEYYPDISWTQESNRQQFLANLESSQSSLAGFVTVNRYIGEEYKAKYSSLPEPHICTNAAKNMPLTAYDGRLHLEAGLDPTCKILLYQGGLSRFRGVEKLIDVSRTLGSDWAIVFMGSGDLEEGVREAQESGSGDTTASTVKLIPPVSHNELPFWTSGATVGALLYEPVNTNQRLCSPNKLWEYSSAGVPIIANNLPFLHETITREGIGWTVNAQANAMEIATSIKSKRPEELAEMSQSGIRFSEEDNWGFEVKGLSDYLKGLRAD